MLALLETLKAAMKDFAAREDKLNLDFRTRSGSEVRTFETAKAAQATRASESVTRAETDFQLAKEKTKSRFEQRKAKLNQAHIKVRKRALDEITDQEAEIKYKVQSGSLEAERVRDEKLVASAAALEDFNHRANETYNRFGLLEASAKKAFGGYGKFKKLLLPEREWPQPDLS